MTKYDTKLFITHNVIQEKAIDGPVLLSRSTTEDLASNTSESKRTLIDVMLYGHIYWWELQTELTYFIRHPEQSRGHSSLIIILIRTKSTPVLHTLIFLNTLLFSGSIMMLYTASGGKPALNLRLRLQREPSGTVTCKQI